MLQRNRQLILSISLLVLCFTTFSAMGASQPDTINMVDNRFGFFVSQKQFKEVTNTSVDHIHVNKNDIRILKKKSAQLEESTSNLQKVKNLAVAQWKYIALGLFITIVCILFLINQFSQDGTNVIQEIQQETNFLKKIISSTVKPHKKFATRVKEQYNKNFYLWFLVLLVILLIGSYFIKRRNKK